MALLEHVDFRELEGAVVARVSGDIDLSNAESVQERLLEAVPNTATALVLDLSDTHYLDSSGVRLIFEVAVRLRNRRQRFELVVPDGSMVKRVLLLTQVQQVVPISTSVDRALHH